MAISSTLLKNISKLRASLKDEIDYIDVSYKGLDDKGSVTVYDEKCVIQRYKIWLQSDEYDYIRRPEFGGFLTRHVIKTPLLEGNERLIESQLRAETKSFFPDIILDKVEVKADIPKRAWTIKVSVTDRKTGLSDNSMFDSGISIIKEISR